MFEDRSRQRRKNLVLLTVFLILLAAFGFGYYMNYGGNDNAGKNATYNNDVSGYRIPDSIRNQDPSDNVITEVEAETPEDHSTNASSNDCITPTTKVIFKTYFTLCGHMLDKDPDSMDDLINLTEEDLKNKYNDWKVNEFSQKQVILTREKQTYCPRHYIIGVKDGNIAIYVYDAEGNKVLHDETDTPISTLTPEDQKNLEYGVVADSEDELQQKLEGFSE
ncbi:MAG: hypothetical protein K0R84_590 [Clostridia bacterium]|nr:hypothetical protein [Clostridia bacterium]